MILITYGSSCFLKSQRDKFDAWRLSGENGDDVTIEQYNYFSSCFDHTPVNQTCVAPPSGCDGAIIFENYVSHADANVAIVQSYRWTSSWYI